MLSKLRDRRKQLDLSQAELGAMINVSQEHISAIELGVRVPSLAILIRLSKALNVDLREFITYFE
jgi:transcriptional regulator with XRE-family HTH domain